MIVKSRTTQEEKQRTYNNVIFQGLRFFLIEVRNPVNLLVFIIHVLAFKQKLSNIRYITVVIYNYYSYAPSVTHIIESLSLVPTRLSFECWNLVSKWYMYLPSYSVYIEQYIQYQKTLSDVIKWSCHRAEDRAGDKHEWFDSRANHKVLRLTL